MAKRVELQSDQEAQDKSELVQAEAEEARQLHGAKKNGEASTISEEKLSEQIEEISLKQLNVKRQELNLLKSEANSEVQSQIHKKEMLI